MASAPSTRASLCPSVSSTATTSAAGPSTSLLLIDPVGRAVAAEAAEEGAEGEAAAGEAVTAEEATVMVAVVVTVVAVTVGEGRAITVEGWDIWRGTVTREPVVGVAVAVEAEVEVEVEVGGSGEVAEDMVAAWAAEVALTVGKKAT